MESTVTIKKHSRLLSIPTKYKHYDNFNRIFKWTQKHYF
jgi:hypothetical protein